MARTMEQAVGASVVRKDGLAKITGAAEYLDDLTIPNAVVAALLRSPYAHARIRSGDYRRAPPHAGRPRRRHQRDDLGDVGARLFGSYIKDQPVLARGVVRYEGEPVVAGVAATPAPRGPRRHW